MAELGVGYVSIIPETSKITPGIAKALGAAEPAVEAKGKSMGGRISSGIGTALKGTALGVGAAAGGLIAGGITKGMGRLTGIENAQASLRGLGHDAGSVGNIMDDALASVKGTAFGLEAAAGVAASAVAAGIQPGDDLERTLKMVGDAATIAGTDMSTMGSIVNKVATSDMMQMDVANQLMDAGIPILDMVGEQMGVTADEARKLASEGKVSFEIFQNALEEGFGGAALEAGDTFEGALANMGAALGRVGATALGPFFDLSKDGFNLATEALDGLNAKIGPVASQLSGWLNGTAIPAVKSFGAELRDFAGSAAVQDRLAALGTAFDSIVSAGRALLPVVVDVGTALGQAGMAIGAAAWDAFVGTLTTAADVAKSLSGPLEVVSGFLADHPGLVTAAVAAWGASKVVPGVLEKITAAVNPAWEGIKTFGFHTSEATRLAQWMNPELSKSEARFVGLTSQVKRGAHEMGGFRGAASKVLGVFGGPWGLALMAAGAGITSLVTAHSNAKTASAEYAEALSRTSDVQAAFTAAVAGTTGALSEQAQQLAADVVENSMAGLDAFAQHSGSFVWKLPEPDSTEFTQSIREAAERAMEESNAIFNGSDGAINNAYQRISSEVKDAYGELEKYLTDSGQSMEDLYGVVARGGPEFDALVNHIGGLSDGGRVLADELVGAREELIAIEEAARRVDPAAAQAAAGIDILADSASTGEDKLKALESVMQAMGLAPKDAERAMMDAAAAVDEIVESAAQANRPVEELGQNLFDMNGALLPTNESARDLSEKLNGMREELQNVALNGGDTQAAFETMQGAVGALATEFGLTEDEVRELYEAYGILPDEINTLVNLNSEGISSELATIWSQLYPLEEGTTIEVGAVGDEALAVLDEIGIEYELTPDGKNVVITAAGDDALNELEAVANKMADVGEMDASPTVFLDKTPLDVSASDAQTIIDTLDIQNPSPQAQLIIDELLANGQIAQGDLNYLGAMSPRPTADLNKQLLDSGVQVSRGSLDDLGRKVSTPKVTVDNSQAYTGIQNVKNWLAGIKDRVVNIFTNRRDNAADGRITYAASGLLSQQNAQIARGGQWITWAEDETEGESFIPHALSKRRRSTQILAETASIFGMGLVDRGGNPVSRDGSPVGPTSVTNFADGGVRSAAEVLAFARGERVAGHQAARSLEGAPYVFGGHNWGDCSSAQGMLAEFATGHDPIGGGRYMATVNEQAQLARLGFTMGLGAGSRLAIGWLNGGPGGGHTSGTIHFPDGTSVNVEMGGGRGNGQIGGGAAPASHPQYTDRAHIPLGGLSLEYGEIDSDYDTSMGGVGANGEIASTSVNGAKLKSGKSVSWGEADDLYKQALDYTSRRQHWQGVDFRDMASGLVSALGNLPLRDTGGRVPNDYAIANRSGADELVLTNAQWRQNTLIAQALPIAGREITRAGEVLAGAAGQFAAAVDQADRQVLYHGRGFGGDFLGSAEIVRDAEQGLLDTRANIATQADNVGEAEAALAEAREELAKAESEGGGLSVAQKRKLADAEEALTKARASGDPGKIADAEKKLTRAREDADAALEKSEDKNAQNVRKAQEGVNKAEDKLAETRAEHQEVLDSLEAAERTAIAARYQAASDLAGSLGEAWSESLDSISGLFDEMDRLAGIVDDTRQSVSKLQMQQQTANLDRIKSMHDLQVKTMDLGRVQARGVISMAEAEWTLQQAREQATLAGETGIEAMSGAMDRFYRTGVFSVGSISAEAVEASEEVRHALWGVQVAQKQNALEQFEAARAQEVAQLRVAEATLMQVKSARMLELQTAQLTRQTAQLNGMTQNQATGAAAGFGGLGRLGGGLGKIVSGLLAGAAGFAVGGPLGALAAAPGLLSGIGDVLRGGADVANNTAEMGQAWSEMDGWGKASIIGGSLLGVAAPVAGGYLGGADGAALGAEAGAAAVDALVGSYQHSVASKLDAINRRADDEMIQFEREMELREHELNMLALDREIDSIGSRDRLEADVEYAKLMQDSVVAPTEKLREAYEAAAKEEKQRSEAQHEDQMTVGRETNRLLEVLADDKGLAPLVGVLGKLATALQSPRSSASGVDYMSARIG